MEGNQGYLTRVGLNVIEKEHIDKGIVILIVIDNYR